MTDANLSNFGQHAITINWRIYTKQELTCNNSPKLILKSFLSGKMELSGPKKISLKKNVTDKLVLINTYKSQEKFDVEEFKVAFKPMSAVWKIFLLHLIKPEYYPIYDQHIHRAYLYIHQKDYSDIKNTISNIAKEDFYFKKYLEFVHSIEGCSLKQIDEALFAFGRFLNSSYAKMLK